jgi:hypothetical protein
MFYLITTLSIYISKLPPRHENYIPKKKILNKTDESHQTLHTDIYAITDIYTLYILGISYILKWNQTFMEL